jgi:hypothetical protein
VQVDVEGLDLLLGTFPEAGLSSAPGCVRLLHADLLAIALSTARGRGGATAQGEASIGRGAGDVAADVRVSGAAAVLDSAAVALLVEAAAGGRRLVPRREATRGLSVCTSDTAACPNAEAAPPSTGDASDPNFPDKQTVDAGRPQRRARLTVAADDVSVEYRCGAGGATGGRAAGWTPGAAPPFRQRLAVRRAEFGAAFAGGFCDGSASAADAAWSHLEQPAGATRRTDTCYAAY